jgi:hypothetical protein
MGPRQSTVAHRSTHGAQAGESMGGGELTLHIPGVLKLHKGVPARLPRVHLVHQPNLQQAPRSSSRSARRRERRRRGEAHRTAARSPQPAHTGSIRGRAAGSRGRGGSRRGFIGGAASEQRGHGGGRAHLGPAAQAGESGRSGHAKRPEARRGGGAMTRKTRRPAQLTQGNPSYARRL